MTYCFSYCFISVTIVSSDSKGRKIEFQCTCINGLINERLCIPFILRSITCRPEEQVCCKRVVEPRGWFEWYPHFINRLLLNRTAVQ